jgi:hypothetical protein
VRFVLGLLLSLVLAPAAPSRAAEPLPPDRDPTARVVVVRAPHATLRLRLATRVGEDLALHCATELPPHGGMLVSVRPANGATIFTPRYQFAHVDEVALDGSGTVIAALLDAPRITARSDAAFVVRARYIIDVPAGEALADGLVPGQKVRIEADAATLIPERDHSRPPTPFCPLVLTVPSATPPAPWPSATPAAPCIPPGPSAQALPVSFEEGQLDVPIAAKPLVFYIESTVDGKVTLRSANGVIGPVPLNSGGARPYAVRTVPPGSSGWRMYSTPPVGPLQPNTEYLVTIDGWEYPGPCQKRYGATLHFRTR